MQTTCLQKCVNIAKKHFIKGVGEWSSPRENFFDGKEVVVISRPKDFA